jgi:hypothetical protein
MKFHLALITGLALISPFATVAQPAVRGGKDTVDGTDYSPAEVKPTTGGPKALDPGLLSRTMEAIAIADADADADAGSVGTLVLDRRELIRNLNQPHEQSLLVLPNDFDICSKTIVRDTNPCTAGLGNAPDIVRFTLDAKTTYNIAVRRITCGFDPISQLFTVSPTTKAVSLTKK